MLSPIVDRFAKVGLQPTLDFVEDSFALCAKTPLLEARAEIAEIAADIADIADMASFYR
jgi:hypothetical protein